MESIFVKGAIMASSVFGSPVADVIVFILGIFGFAGIFSGIVVRIVGKKIDKSDKTQEDRQKAYIRDIVLKDEGLVVVGRVASLTACAYLKEHAMNTEIASSLIAYDAYRMKQDEQQRQNNAEFLQGRA